MLKIFLNFLNLFRSSEQRSEFCAEWIRDPLSHPQIAAMGERRRADLPFDPRAIPPQ
ncbi:hypothetical protein ACWKW9_15460 [Rhizobium daejeonense]